MDFKKWFNEWEGNSFPTGEYPGDNPYVNGPEYPSSKYTGKQQKNSPDEPSELGKVEKMYGLKPRIIIKRMNKKG